MRTALHVVEALALSLVLTGWGVGLGLMLIGMWRG